MNKDLYFIPILQRAFEAPDPSRALSGALDEIRVLGRQPELRRGYEQFLAFMTEAAQAVESTVADDLGTNEAEYKIAVEVDGWELAVFRFSPERRRANLDGIRPGVYTLRAGTGVALWRKRLTDAELIHGGEEMKRPLPLAADTEDAASLPTRMERAFYDSVIVKVFSGFESGRLQVEISGAAAAGRKG